MTIKIPIMPKLSKDDEAAIREVVYQIKKVGKQ